MDKIPCARRSFIDQDLGLDQLHFWCCLRDIPQEPESIGDVMQPKEFISGDLNRSWSFLMTLSGDNFRFSLFHRTPPFASPSGSMFAFLSDNASNRRVASSRSLWETIAYRLYTLSVLCPVSFMPTEREIPACSNRRTVVRRES